MPYRRRARRDRNESSLVKVIRQCGGHWLPLNVKDGPDGVLGFQGTTVLIECKTPKGKLRPGQSEFRETWRGGPIYVLRTVEDVVKLLGKS